MYKSTAVASIILQFAQVSITFFSPACHLTARKPISIYTQLDRILLPHHSPQTYSDTAGAHKYTSVLIPVHFYTQTERPFTVSLDQNSEIRISMCKETKYYCKTTGYKDRQMQRCREKE